MPHLRIALSPLTALTLVGVSVNDGSGPGSARPEMTFSTLYFNCH